MPFHSMFIEPRVHITPVPVVHSVIIMMTDCYRLESSSHHVRGIKRFWHVCIRLVCSWYRDRDAWQLTQQLIASGHPSLASSLCATSVLPIHGSETFHITLSYRHLSTFVRSATTSCVPKWCTTSNHGLRLPHLSKHRRDRGQRFGISERSFEHHKASSSQTRPSTSGNFSQRASWCDHGPRSGPDSCKSALSLISTHISTIGTHQDCLPKLRS